MSFSFTRDFAILRIEKMERSYNKKGDVGTVCTQRVWAKITAPLTTSGVS